MSVQNSATLTVKYNPLVPFTVFIIAFAPALAAYFTGKTALLMVCLTLPFIFYLVANPRHSFYLFLLSIAVYYPYHLTGFAVHPFDLAMGLLYFSVVIDFCLHTRTEIRKTGLDLAFIFLIIATLISAVFAYNVRKSIVPLFRIIVIYLSFRVVFKMALELSVRKVVLFYIYQVFFLSLINCFLFVIRGGGVRVRLSTHSSPSGQ